jgi:hypothetical protein
MSSVSSPGLWKQPRDRMSQRFEISGFWSDKMSHRVRRFQVQVGKGQRKPSQCYKKSNIRLKYGVREPLLRLVM